jgi:hypothetical protein
VALKKLVVLWVDEEEGIPPVITPTMQVFEQDPPAPVLLDYRGEPIRRAKPPIGFGRS